VLDQTAEKRLLLALNAPVTWQLHSLIVHLLEQRGRRSG
jgi:hypothetical protein